MRLFTLLLLLLSGEARADQRVVVAVADFAVAASSPDLAPLGKGLAQMLITDLTVSDSIRLVERARLREVLGEIELQRSPYFDADGAAKLGRGLGAELIVTGQLLAEGQALRLDVRAIDVETSEVLLATKVEGQRSGIFDLQRKIAGEVLKGLGARVTPIGRKRIGKRGTKSYDALAKFGAALDAEDKGATAELRKHLAAALAADPEFAAAQDRLAALEERVGTLEKSGGLILEPTSWRDHLHNFKIHRERSDLVQAERSIRAALSLEGRRAELWSAYHDLPKRVRAKAARAARLDDASKAALTAYLDADLASLRDAPDSEEHPAFRPVLAVDLVGRRLSAFTFTAAVVLHRALGYVLAPKNRRLIEPMLVDREAFFSLARNLQREHLEGRDPPAPWGEHLMVAPPKKSDGSSSAWKVHVRLAERPSTPVDVIVRRVPLPRGEKPYPNAGLWETERSRNDDPARRKALLSGKSYGWYVHGSANPFDRRGVKGHARFGRGFKIPNEDGYIRCELASKSPTGQRCEATVVLKKLSMPPGAYDVELGYRDAAGTEVRWRNRRFWIWEFNLAEFKTGLWRHSDPYFFVNPIDDRVRERLDPEQIARRGKNAFAMVARPCANPPIARDQPAPLKSIHYDVDFRLNRGKRIEAGNLGAWKRYRRAILSKGYAAKPHRKDGCGNAPLPKLSPGEHELCFVAERTNGSVTLEPECFTVKVPARYPQEGRKPR